MPKTNEKKNLLSVTHRKYFGNFLLYLRNLRNCKRSRHNTGMDDRRMIGDAFDRLPYFFLSLAVFRQKFKKIKFFKKFRMFL